MPSPVRSGRITAVFGPTDEPLDSGGFNKGVDFGVPVGTEFVFVRGGTVVHAGPGTDGWGISVKVRDEDGVIHNYGHLSQANVSVGDTVEAGQLGGLTGNTGASTGPHLSYDTYSIDGRGVDPSPYLGFNAVGDNRNSELLGRDVTELASYEGGSQMADESAVRYWESRREYNALFAQYGMWLENPDLAQQLKLPPPPPEVLQRIYQLDAELADFEETYQPGASPGEIKAAYDLFNSTDPRVIDAENAANKYAREYATRTDAANMAGEALRTQLDTAKEATDSQQALIDSAAGGGPRLAGAVAMPARLKTGDELFADSLAKLTAKLPEVPDYPYPARPSSVESVLSGTRGATPPRPVGMTATYPESITRSGMLGSASNTVAESDTAHGGRASIDPAFNGRMNLSSAGPITNVAPMQPATGMPPPSAGQRSPGIRGAILETIKRSRYGGR